MRQKNRFILMALSLTLLAASLFAQEGPQGPGDMDRITETLAARMDQRLRTLAPQNNPPKIAVGRFTVAGEDSPLGDLLRASIIGALANRESRPYLLIDTAPGAPGTADYLLNGDILEVAPALRVSAKLVKVSDSSIIGVWTVDFELTSWVEGLVERPASSGVRRDRYETDSQENPVAVEIGADWMDRTIHQAEDRDWFLIIHPTGGLLTAETSGDMDTMMELYDEGGNRLSSNDDGGTGENARITFNAEAGKRYTAMVRGYSTHTGAYRFHVTTETVADEAVEPNNTQEQATLLTLGSSGFRAFLSPGDEDWYKAEVPEGGALVTVYTEGDLDTFLRVHDASGARLAEDDDSGSGTNARITINLPVGIFYIRATLYSDSSSQGTYTIFVQTREPTAQDSYEPDNQISQAKDIEAGQSQTRNFTDASDVDWVRLRITQAGKYGIRARGVTRADLDTYIELLDASETIIGEDDDGGSGYDAYLSINLQPGTYYIKVTTLDREPAGNYTLSVAAE